LGASGRHAKRTIAKWSAGGPVQKEERARIKVEMEEVEEEKAETRRPRHTKPRRPVDGPVVKLIVSGGRSQGREPADVIGAIVDNSHLGGEGITNGRGLERFSFVGVTAKRAEEVIDKVSGQAVRGATLRLEVAKR